MTDPTETRPPEATPTAAVRADTAAADTAAGDAAAGDAATEDLPDGAQPFVLVQLPAMSPETGEPREGVALVTLNRPKVMNALNFTLLAELAVALGALDADDRCRAIVVTGARTRAFASGADIEELRYQTPDSLEVGNAFASWNRIWATKKPVIAAVRGYALGGGCELAMSCDMIVAGDDARFGQPEIKIGVIPGAGGTQRLTRAIGKARATELILTGRMIDAAEAERLGLVTRVVPAEQTLGVALELASKVAAMPPLAVLAAKQAVSSAFELSLTDGLASERAAFFSLFATEDQKEGMAAFAEKRPAVWRGR